MSSRKSAITQLIICFTVLLLGFLFIQSFGSVVVSGWRRNLVFITAIQSLSSSNKDALPGVVKILSSQNNPDCRVQWLVGILYNSLNELEQRDEAFRMALHCSPGYVELIRTIAPDNLSLAESAVKDYPDQAEAWFWLAKQKLNTSPEEAIHFYWNGLRINPKSSNEWIKMSNAFASLEVNTALRLYEQLGFDRIAVGDPDMQVELIYVMARILVKSQPETAIQLYRQGLRRKPNDGVRWYELGDLLSTTDLQAAFEAYVQSCSHGDPGSHGCYGAAWIAERQGNFPLAIFYYHKSSWEEAQKRAVQLEQMTP
jgi:tetratricopeptide (TPR) repeat protein